MDTGKLMAQYYRAIQMMGMIAIIISNIRTADASCFYFN